MSFEQRFDFAPQFIIARAGGGQEVRARFRRAFHSLIKQAVYFGPAFSVHKRGGEQFTAGGSIRGKARPSLYSIRG